MGDDTMGDDTNIGPVTAWLVGLLRARLDAGESIGGLARETGVTRANLSRLLAGKKTVTLATADRIVAGLRLGPNRWRGWGLARPDEAWHERF